MSPQSTNPVGVACSGPRDPRFALFLKNADNGSPYPVAEHILPALALFSNPDLTTPMPNRTPPSFPQPFAPAGTSYPARDVAGTPEQRFIDPAQASTYSPDSMFARNTLGTSLDTSYWSQPPLPVRSHGSTPHLMPILNAPPQHPSPHLAPYIPPYQLVQDPIRTPPAFPVPQVQGTRVPRPTPYPPPPMLQTTHTPGYLNNTQVSPGLYSSYPPQTSHLPSQHESGVSGAAHNAPLFQRNPPGGVVRVEDDSDDEGYQAYQGSPVMHDGNMRAKGPPSYVAHGVPDTDAGDLIPLARHFVQDAIARGPRY
ncbi:hypothetical protein EDB84DRAFT_1570484 [Lactarius hengduanensis]|nr:hypothetical protein EDB84DRAFT_1570484 [Lactarius hengduanensis]